MPLTLRTASGEPKFIFSPVSAKEPTDAVMEGGPFISMVGKWVLRGIMYVLGKALICHTIARSLSLAC